MSFINGAISTEGTIINLIEIISDDESGISYRPEVQFKTEAGDVRTFMSSLGSNPPQFDIGSNVKVLYDADITNAEIDSFMTLWFVSVGMIFIALIIGTISVVGLIRVENGKAMGVIYNLQFNGREMF